MFSGNDKNVGLLERNILVHQLHLIYMLLHACPGLFFLQSDVHIGYQIMMVFLVESEHSNGQGMFLFHRISEDSPVFEKLNSCEKSLWCPTHCPNIKFVQAIIERQGSSKAENCNLITLTRISVFTPTEAFSPYQDMRTNYSGM